MDCNCRCQVVTQLVIRVIIRSTWAKSQEQDGEVAMVVSATFQRDRSTEITVEDRRFLRQCRLSGYELKDMVDVCCPYRSLMIASLM